MSRGPGYLHYYLFQTISAADHPLTFAEIIAIAKPHEEEYRPHMVRSMRRTLAKMVAGNVLCAERVTKAFAKPPTYSVLVYLGGVRR